MKNLLLLVFLLMAIESCESDTNDDEKNKNVKLQLIRNATLKLHYGETTFLVDPMLGEKNSFMSFVEPNKNLNPTIDLPLPISEINKDIDAILLTHAHPDHFDQKAIEVLNKELPLYIQPSDLIAINKTEFQAVKVVETSTQLNEITITRTGGKHGPEETLETLGEVSGFVLQAKEQPTIYIVGDCVFDTEIEENIMKFKPDYIITNSGGAIFMGQTRILMDEKETVKVAKLAPSAKVIAVHMEALDHCQTTREILKSEAQREKVDILIPKDGELLQL